MRAALTGRDLEILDTLTQRVRVLTVAQIARTWWSTSTAIGQARRRLNDLSRAGWVHIFDALAHPEIELAAPLASWKPNDPPPDFPALSYALKNRWSLAPAPAVCIIASIQSARHFAGHGGRFPRETEQTHDIHLAAVYLRFRTHWPDQAPYWQSEAEIAECRGNVADKLPDAILAFPSGSRAIEFGGAYHKEKLRAFHRYCSEISLPYEVW